MIRLGVIHDQIVDLIDWQHRFNALFKLIKKRKLDRFDQRRFRCTFKDIRVVRRSIFRFHDDIKYLQLRILDTYPGQVVGYLLIDCHPASLLYSFFPNILEINRNLFFPDYHSQILNKFLSECFLLINFAGSFRPGEFSFKQGCRALKKGLILSSFRF